MGTCAQYRYLACHSRAIGTTWLRGIANCDSAISSNRQIEMVCAAPTFIDVTSYLMSRNLTFYERPGKKGVVKRSGKWSSVSVLK